MSLFFLLKCYSVLLRISDIFSHIYAMLFVLFAARLVLTSQMAQLAWFLDFKLHCPTTRLCESHPPVTIPSLGLSQLDGILAISDSGSSSLLTESYTARFPTSELTISTHLSEQLRDLRRGGEISSLVEYLRPGCVVAVIRIQQTSMHEVGEIHSLIRTVLCLSTLTLMFLAILDFKRVTDLCYWGVSVAHTLVEEENARNDLWVNLERVFILLNLIMNHRGRGLRCLVKI